MDQDSKVGPPMHSGNHSTPLLPVTDMEDTTHTTQTPPQPPDHTDYHYEGQHASTVNACRPALENSKAFDFTGPVDCTFTNVFSESKGSQSLDAVSTRMDTVYSVTQQVTYTVLTVFIGTFLVVIWAIIFAISNFFIVWLIQPFLKLIFMFLRVFGDLNRVLMRSTVQPLFLAVSMLYSNFKGSFNVNVAAQELTEDYQQMV